jgi:hypothetical protein
MEPFLHLQVRDLDHLQLKMLMEQRYGLNLRGYRFQKSAASVSVSRRIPRLEITQPSSSF